MPHIFIEHGFEEGIGWIVSWTEGSVWGVLGTHWKFGIIHNTTYYKVADQS